MPMYHVAELHEGLFANPLVKQAPVPTVGWRFFAPCSEDSVESCSVLCHDIFAFKDERTRKDFRRLMMYLFEAGKAGKPWKEIFQSGKQFHPVHSFEVDRIDPKTGKQHKQTVEVHQFKKLRTDVRVLFVYGGSSPIVFITHTFEKRDAKTPHAEQARAEREAKSFLSALDSRHIRIVTEQGGKDETDRTFQ